MNIYYKVKEPEKKRRQWNMYKMNEKGMMLWGRKETRKGC